MATIENVAVTFVGIERRRSTTRRSVDGSVVSIILGYFILLIDKYVCFVGDDQPYNQYCLFVDKSRSKSNRQVL